MSTLIRGLFGCLKGGPNTTFILKVEQNLLELVAVASFVMLLAKPEVLFRS